MIAVNPRKGDSPKEDETDAEINLISFKKELCKLIMTKHNKTYDKKLKFTNTITDADVLNIYKDVSKISDIENYLHLLYRPFECRLKTGCKFRLTELVTHLSNTDYDPTKSGALVVRWTRPTCTLKVFKNGNIVCQAISYESAVAGCKNMMSLMENIGFMPKSKQANFNVVNATFRVPFSIDTQQLYVKHLPQCFYNPEKQPYLLFEIRSLKVKLAIFPNGHVYVILSSQPSYTREAIALIMPILYRYRAVVDKTDELELSVGDVNFELLWEQNLQTLYHPCIPKYFK